MAGHAPQFQNKTHPVIPWAGVHEGELYIPDVDTEGRLLARIQVWNPSTLEYEDATGSIGAGASAEVTNWPATLVGPKVPVSNDLDDPLAKYQISNIPTDFTADVLYFGYEEPAAGWYIMKLVLSTGIALYAKGDSGYAAAWANPGGLSFDTYPNTFGN